jgi:excisionase family DNA binding protein
MTDHTHTQLLSVAAAAERLDVSRGHIYHLIREGHLRTVDLHATGTKAKTRIYETDLEAFIQARTSPRAEKGGSRG